MVHNIASTLIGYPIFTVPGLAKWHGRATPTGHCSSSAVSTLVPLIVTRVSLSASLHRAWGVQALSGTPHSCGRHSNVC